MAVAVAAQLFTGTAIAATTTSSASQAAGICRNASSGSLAFARCEAKNLSVSQQNITQNRKLLPGVVAASTQYQADRFRALVADPERSPNPNPCTAVVPCPVDPRLSIRSFEAHGGVVKPVLYTSRSGATISGHVWAMKKGAAKRPGVVVTNGSIVGFEQVYWYLAQTLARSGFVVLTWDAQGEGHSDQFGQGADAVEDAFAATPGTGFLQGRFTGDLLGGNGLTFYDGVEDALDFFMSTSEHSYVPRLSRSGTSHAAKQSRRVFTGQDAAYNPLASMLDRRKIGLTGHSYGAFATSWQVQQDPRVKTGVALDNLCYPTSPSDDEAASLLRPNPDSGRCRPRRSTASRRTAWARPTVRPPRKYPMGGKRGDRMLRSNRWQHDAATRSIDPAKDPNLLSWHFRSRMDITTRGKRWICRDLRAGCRGQTRSGKDGFRGAYSFVKAR